MGTSITQTGTLVTHLVLKTIGRPGHLVVLLFSPFKGDT